MPVPPRVLVAAAVGFLALRAALFAVTTAGEHAVYHNQGSQARATSLAELYRARDIEYPPLATLAAVAVLELAEALPDGVHRLTAWRPEPTRGVELARYEVALGLALFAVDLACLALVAVAARSIYPADSPAKRLGRMGLYVAATTALGLIFFDRQDPVVALAAVAAVAAFARGRSLLAYALLAAGVAFKLVPLLLFPPFVLAAATARAGAGPAFLFARAVLREALVAGLVLAVVPALMFAFSGGERAFVFLKFHSARGLQIESSTAWLVMLAEPATQVGHSYGSYSLRGGLADRVARATTPGTALVAALSILLSVPGFRRAADRGKITSHLVASSLLVWIGFILSTKVGSPQYLLWLAPLLPLLPLRGADRYWVVLVLAAMGVTTLIFPGQYTLVKGLPVAGDDSHCSGPTPVGLAMLAAKAVLLAAAYVWLAVMVWRARLIPANGHA
jgi:hypothetical protein